MRQIFDSSGDGLVPDCIQSHVVGAYSNLGQWNALENGTNPVKKVPLAVDGHDLEVIIDEIIGGDGAGGDVGGEGEGDVRIQLGLHHQEVRMLSSQVLHRRCELADTQAKHVRQLGIIRGQLTRLNQTFCASQTVLLSSSATLGKSVTTMTWRRSKYHYVMIKGANLLKCPRMLNDLWREYEFGMCGNKPAKDFPPP